MPSEPAKSICAKTGSPQIRVKPGISPWNSKIYIRLAGFASRAPVTLNLRAIVAGPPPQAIWEAEAVFQPDQYGMVDVGLQEPLSADPGFMADPLGLFGMNHLSDRNDCKTGYTLALSALTGGKVIASAIFRRPPRPDQAF